MRFTRDIVHKILQKGLDFFRILLYNNYEVVVYVLRVHATQVKHVTKYEMRYCVL